MSLVFKRNDNYFFLKKETITTDTDEDKKLIKNIYYE